MKAIVLKDTKLQLEEINAPSIAANQVLVKVKAISINPVDVKTGQGKAFYNQIKDESPVIVGWDISGEVAEVGPDVTRFKVGDAVFGMVNFPGHGKAYAEYVAAPEDHLALKPAAISHEEAAAATLAALTAWQVLVTKAKLQAGQKVLIHAAAGGVGHYAVQIAKHLGAFVIGTSSASKKDFIMSLGADQHIDYTSQQFEEVVQDADVVLDSLGPGNVARSIETLKKGGIVISILGFSPENEQKAKDKGVEGFGYLVASNGDDMRSLAKLLETGEMKSVVSHTFRFEQMQEAHDQVNSGKTQGKVVVTIE
ncbi:NADP-dependent oxidoreductase [Pontibacter sp. SGAir0037]|uniref:NADP-dependent oxidoreductase n=1 Tax=Pontibacter sp. SGAir0037 TaxID=2571030 RepID=UPI0010CD2AB7|nr:NADP-dependent oxidoreductase [Pontibacter sp. SGAir0037]QCR21348.1 oxidoreductase [Pontibacter sp. SGAir0037]